MADEAVQNELRELRERAGLTQQALAGRAGISRQALGAIEAGRAAPSVVVALRLARALGRRVEEVFRLDEGDAVLEAEAALPEGPRSRRVVLAASGDRWFAHFLPDDLPGSLHVAADAIAEGPGEGAPTAGGRPTKGARGTVRVRPLVPLEEARRRLVVAGCAPPLGVLARRACGPDAVWIGASSEQALAMLARGQVHVAGAHLLDEASGQFNVPMARRLLGGRALVVTLARWEQGLVVRRGNPLDLRTVADALRVRFAGREPGAGAHSLLARLARREGLPPGAQPAGPVVRGHMEVGQAVALGAADAGIAIRSAALAYGLDFVPLAEERFDLVLGREAASDPRLARLLDTLEGGAFRRELEGMGGYAAGETGSVVAEGAAS